MKEPSMFEYITLIAVCLFMAVAGLYLLVNFSRLFRNTIKNEIVRKNAAAWVIIFCISTAMLPMSGSFFYMLSKFGWLKSILGQITSVTLTTLVVYNLARIVVENRALKKLSFIKHKLLILLSLIVSTLTVNIPFTYYLFNGNTQYLQFAVINSIYLAGAIGLVYAVISYFEIERKRKFDEKEFELGRLRELKSKAELDALHSKVNPHFLYNALNSIADLSVTDGKKARKMTLALADLFRYNINYGQNNYAAISEEMTMTEVYLQIEKIRFEDQLSYSIQTDERTGYYLVPRFILQPLVENAVKHGLKITGQMTEILLDVRLQEKELVLIIADNGPLFPDDLIPGYGVKSVFDKLDLLFPGQYEIYFSNHPRKQVAIHIRKLIKNEPGV